MKLRQKIRGLLDKVSYCSSSVCGVTLIVLVVKNVAVPHAIDFSFEYTPSITTLFRFSALTFNAHRIHLDQKHAQQHEGYPGRSFDF